MVRRKFRRRRRRPDVARSVGGQKNRLQMSVVGPKCQCLARILFRAERITEKYRRNCHRAQHNG